MPKDNENVPFPLFTTDDPEASVLSPFAREQMLRCDECLRANPPTRVNCLYCGAPLPHNKATLNLRKPALRPLEKWEQGYNNILRAPVANPAAALLAEAADLLRLRPDDLSLILSSSIPLPLARAATINEAELVQDRLSSLGIDSSIMPDAEPGTDATFAKVRALEIDEAGVAAYQSPETAAIRISWSDFVLLVAGRLRVKRVELREGKGARAEKDILDASEFVTDEMVFDFYSRNKAVPYRIAANSFDFSCLGPNKGLLAGENLSRLLQLFREQAAHAVYDDSFNSVRKMLEVVWPSEQQIESSGWRRERPGKYSLGSATELSNETQFLRYSCLRYYLLSATLPTTQTGGVACTPEKTDDDS